MSPLSQHIEVNIMIDLIIIIYTTLAVICLIGLGYAFVKLIQHGEIAFIIAWTSGLVVSLSMVYMGITL